MVFFTVKTPTLLARLALFLCFATVLTRASTPPEVPDWAQPGSATHKQVPPPTDFHRATKTTVARIGQFEGQSDIGGAVVEGTGSYDPKSKRYTINSAGYNIWYTRDEFHYLWKKISGDVSLAADITFPNAEGYGDRKAVLVIRQDLDDDSKEIMSGLHGAGLIHLAERTEKKMSIKEDARIEPAGAGQVKRIGIEKRGDTYTLFVGSAGEAMHQVGNATTLHLEAPFYVGIGFCSHLPATSDTAILSNVVLENKAGKVR